MHQPKMPKISSHDQRNASFRGMRIITSVKGTPESFNPIPELAKRRLRKVI
jgi:hypothetical protein